MALPDVRRRLWRRMVTGRHAARLPGHWTQRVGRGSVSGIVEGGCLRSDARAAAPQTVCAPSEGIHPIGSVHPVWGHSTREARFNLIGSIAPDQNGLNDHRWDVSPHRQQAPARSWPPVPLPRFCRRHLSGVYRHRPTRACAAGPVGVSSQRSARPCPRPSMSHVIPLRLVQMLNPHRWNCNVFGRSRKVTEGKLRAKYVWRLSGRRPRAPWLGSCLEARPRSPTLRPLRLGVCRADDGGFAALEASCRRVAGVSWLYWCNSPRLVAVRSRFEAVWRPKRRPPRRQTPTTRCRGRGGLRSGHNGAWPCVEHARTAESAR